MSDKEDRKSQEHCQSSGALGYVPLVRKWRLKAKEYTKEYGRQTGCVPCEKQIIAETLRRCAKELIVKISKST